MIKLMGYQNRRNKMNVEKYLQGFFPGTKGPTLDAMKYFMEKLGHPEEKLKFIHIAGTNGIINPLLWITMTFRPTTIHITI